MDSKTRIIVDFICVQEPDTVRGRGCGLLMVPGCLSDCMNVRARTITGLCSSGYIQPSLIPTCVNRAAQGGKLLGYDPNSLGDLSQTAFPTGLSGDHTKMSVAPALLALVQNVSGCVLRQHTQKLGS